VIDGKEAHALGLVSHMSEDPIAHARALAKEIATRSPDAVAAAKFLMQDAWCADEATASAAERRWQRALVGRANQRLAIERNTKPGEARDFKRREL
jgi:enoyl-CoA hydratase/carnithine racemase